MNANVKNRVSSSWLKMISCLWMALAVAGAGFQVATALEDAPAELLKASEGRSQVEEIDRVIYEDDLEDDQGLAYEDELEDDTITQQDLEDINAAKEALDRIQEEAGTRAVIQSPPGSTTIVDANNQYTIVSHDNFGVTRYPNRLSRVWRFYKGVDIQYIVVKCPFFRIQWSTRCRKDKFGIFKDPFIRGIRRCGQIHGFYKKYDIGIKVVFKTNYSIRRAGFTCVVTGIPYPPPPTTTTSTSTTTITSTSTSTTTTSTTTTYAPGCPVKPTMPADRTVVSTCADIRSGYEFCECENVAGGVCLKCSICTACDMEFFAVHDFSATSIYLYLHFNCSEYPIDAASLSFGYEDYLKGYVVCFPPPTHVILPTYPPSSAGSVVIVTSCPVSPGLDVCSVFGSSGRRSLLAHSSLMLDSKQSLSTVRQQRGLQSLAELASTEALAIVGIAVDLSTLAHPEALKNLTVVDSTCEMFPPNQAIDLSSFTSLQLLSLTLCNTPCPNVDVILTSTPLAGAAQDCSSNPASSSTTVIVTIMN